MIELADLLAAGGRLHGATPVHHFSDLSYDSRLTQPGDLFLALRTPRADGHDYIPAALAAGARGVVCGFPPPQAAGATIVLADDPADLIRRWASRRLQQIAPHVIAVTGSVGKTAAVGAIAKLLDRLGPTFRTRQSFNSLLGLPIAIARLELRQRFAVLELGTDQRGEIARLAQLFPPRIAVVTRVAEVHLDRFGALEGIAQEKGALIESLPHDGWAVLNGDDPHVMSMRAQTSAHVLTFGLSAACDLRATQVELAADGTRLCLHWRGRRATAHIPLLGAPAVTTALAAVGAALACGLDLAQAAAALSQVTPEPGRMRDLAASGGAQLLDDSYSASLPSTMAALDTLAALPATRRVVALGTIGDLPADRAAALAAIGRRAAEVADLLVCVGEGAAPIAQAATQARPDRRAILVDTIAAGLDTLQPELRPGARVLVKGGAAARMERISAALINPAVDRATALVRQEAAWHSVRVKAPDRPTWLRIDLDAIGQNIGRLCELAGVPIMVTLKADGYGHGALRVARIALARGAQSLAVATLGEARALREAGITAPILVLGYTPPWQAGEVVELGATCTIFDLDVAQALGAAASARDRTVAAHLKVDTGMARLGIAPDTAATFLQALRGIAGLRIEGIYTHLATADVADETFARAQIARFSQLLGQLAAAGLRPPVAHAANSAALLRFPEAHFDMVRPGIACYGLRPSAETPLPGGFLPALSFHTEIAQVRDVPPGTPISYGGAYVTSGAARIATIPVGYADGFRRSPHWREVLVRGMRAPVVGRVTMDYAMIDVTMIDGVRRGDPVVLIGAQGEETISADEVAGWLGTISYDVVATILPRVPREVE